MKYDPRLPWGRCLVISMDVIEKNRVSEFEMNERPAVRWVRRLAHYYLRGFHSVEMPAASTIPHEGPAILVCNHVSSLDPVILQEATPRLLTWMIAREYYEVRGLKWFFEAIGAIPVDRSGRDLAATRAALRALHAGRIIGMFPEGRISEGGKLLPFQIGVALMAIKAKVPVIPAYLQGTMLDLDMKEPFLMPQRVKLAMGPAITLNSINGDRHDLEAATERIHAAVEGLRTQVGV